MRTYVLTIFVVGAVIAAIGCSSKSGSTSSGTAGAKGSAGTKGAAGAPSDAGTSDGAGTGGNAGKAVADAAVAGTGGADAEGGAGAAGTTDAAGSAGAAGTTDAAGSGGVAGTGVAIVDVGLGFQDTSASVLTRNKHETRDGFFIQPTLTIANVARLKGDTTFAATFSGTMMGSPLYLEDGPAGKGAFYIATTSNDVYALDETTGATVWKHNIGAAPGMTGTACGNVTPVGIIGTPVIDAASRTIFVAGGVGEASTIMHHEVHALNVDTGAERLGWPVDVSTLTAPGAVAFNTPAQNQRGALSLVNGILYVPYGGHSGDCDKYRGWVVAIKIADPTQIASWATGGLGEGIWAPGGMASSGDGVLAITGNNMEGSAIHLDSEEVVHLRGMAQVDRATGIFFPGSWRAMDQGDQDFGASSGVVFNVPGSTPSTVMAAVSKNGLFYLLDPAKLGGMDGYLAQVTGGGVVRTTPIAYRTTKGIYVLFSATNAISFCPPGTGIQPSGAYSIAVAITPGSPPTAKVAWCAGGSVPGFIVTTSDGTHDAVAWINSGGILYGVVADTGVTAVGGDLVCPVAKA